MNILDETLNTPWKAFDEILMYLIKPLISLYLIINNVKIGRGSRFYGFPKILKHKKGTIIIGTNFECRSSRFSNPIGINHPVILSAWDKGSRLVIGNDVGISGGSIVASTNITIGDGTLIGVNSTIIDSDFHPLKDPARRYSKKDIRTGPINIGSNVFIGMNSIILKGSNIKKDAIIPAGSIIRSE